MADFWDQGTEPTDVLPKPELNPLLNPLLERHLGRWAEAYFTSPPERREQAVEELLHELEQETASGEADAQSTACAACRNTPAELLCTACEFKNCAGQNFCGNCGSPLPGGDFRLLHQEPASTSTVKDPDRDIPGVEHVEGDLQQITTTAFSQWDQDPPVTGRRRVLAAGIGAAILLLAASVCLYWFSRHPSAPALTNTVAPPQPGTLQTQSSASAQTGPNAPPVAVSSASDTSEPPRAEPAMTGASPQQKFTATSPSAPAPAIADGNQELLQAEQYLEGESGGRNSAEAARLLWQAVSKQNIPAALLLSDLYMRGDGIPKSCDQARLLLGAAAKRGASKAAQQLLRLEANGCP